MEDDLILVDKNDTPIGTMPKLLAHQLGRLHRAFSIFIFNDHGELLIQQRALHKYHSAGQWANSCCSHPKPGEETQKAAQRRLLEELGFTTELEHVGALMYHAPVSGGLTENEYDHLFIGSYNQNITPNTEEVIATRWINLEQLTKEIKMRPDNFTPWLKKILMKHPLLKFK